jgi:hypothetical protein
MDTTAGTVLYADVTAPSQFLGMTDFSYLFAVNSHPVQPAGTLPAYPAFTEIDLADSGYPSVNYDILQFFIPTTLIGYSGGPVGSDLLEYSALATGPTIIPVNFALLSPEPVPGPILGSGLPALCWQAGVC